MNKNRYSLPVFLLIATCFTTFSAFSEEALEEKEDIRWYQVEVILFTQNDEASLAEEQWNHEEAVEFPEHFQSLYRGKESLKTLPVEPIPFTTVLENETSLNGIAKRLAHSSQTQVALHLAWIQPTTKDSKPVNVHLFPGAGAAAYEKESTGKTTPLSLPIETAVDNTQFYEPGLGFDGLIGLKRGYYLHLNIDMGYQERNVNISPETIFNPEIGYLATENRQPDYLSYRIMQKRRIRSGEIHYFDHPRFGIIAQVTPIELPEPVEIIEEPVTPLELPIPVEQKSGPTASPHTIQKN